MDGVVALLTDDAWLAMPPLPLEYQGRELAARFLTAVAFRHGRTYRLVADPGQRPARVRRSTSGTRTPASPTRTGC